MVGTAEVVVAAAVVVTVTAGDNGGEVVLTLGVAQNRLSHWARACEEKKMQRRKRTREK